MLFSPSEIVRAQFFLKFIRPSTFNFEEFRKMISNWSITRFQFSDLRNVNSVLAPTGSGKWIPEGHRVSRSATLRWRLFLDCWKVHLYRALVDMITTTINNTNYSYDIRNFYSVNVLWNSILETSEALFLFRFTDWFNLKSKTGTSSVVKYLKHQRGGL